MAVNPQGPPAFVWDHKPVLPSLVCSFVLHGFRDGSSHLQGKQQDDNCAIFPAQAIVPDIRTGSSKGKLRTGCSHQRGYGAPGRWGDTAQGCLGESGASTCVLSCSGGHRT